MNMPFDRRESTGYVVNHLARLMARGLTRRIAPLGLSTGEFPVLLELWERDGQTQAELIQRLDVEQATMANTLRRMERDGLIVRRPHETDRRAQTVNLTEYAKSLEAQAKGAAHAQNDEALRDFTDEERRALVGLIQRAIANCQE